MCLCVLTYALGGWLENTVSLKSIADTSQRSLVPHLTRVTAAHYSYELCTLRVVVALDVILTYARVGYYTIQTVGSENHRAIDCIVECDTYLIVYICI